MKLTTFITLFSTSLVLAAVLDSRQQLCSEDDCYRAVWGDESIPHVIQAANDCEDYLTTTVIVYPVTTLTVITRTTSTTTAPCSTTSTITDIVLPISDTPFSALSGAIKYEARQATSTGFFTTTSYGPLPTSVTTACGIAAYTSACLCEGITQSEITLLSTTTTTFATSTFTDLLTTTTSCPVVTISSTGSSSTLSSTSSFTSTSSSSSSITTSSSTSSSDTTSLSTTSSSLSSDTISSTSSASSSSLSTTSTESSSTDTTSTASATPSPPICGGPGVLLCDGGCRDTKTDLNHCGRCGNKCGAQRDCVNGVCASIPCDSRCGWDRMCGASNGTVECTCAQSVEGNGICFDKNKFSCGDPTIITCRSSAFGNGGCPIGSACVMQYCDCGTPPTNGICVRTEGCGDDGVSVLGPLVRIGRMENRRRTLKGFEK